jgi:hypothetical protein
MAAPIGNKYATRARVWSQAIESAVEAWPNPPSYEDCSSLVRGMRGLAFAFVSKMVADKDLAFFREFGDRIEGKAIQGVELGGPNGEPVTFQTITRKIVDPRESGN